ncbi:hypothetical protein [Lysobacter capsici]|uniref:hypothetical protein n=1 Tax=Lysobacter capsici TaxID=435897 RepID=UPI003D2F9BA1
MCAAVRHRAVAGLQQRDLRIALADDGVVRQPGFDRQLLGAAHEQGIRAQIVRTGRRTALAETDLLQFVLIDLGALRQFGGLAQDIERQPDQLADHP